jgi:hypothetical protein
MFLASTCSFILATINVGANLAATGISIHTRLVEYGDRPLAEAKLLAEHQLFKPNLVIYWTYYSVVRFWDRQSLKWSAIDMICSVHDQ